ncbi:hypothetical protein BU25DRAFT_80181 [Macroventuria anomochaeta]|uniref:Uncharacterized protein n=1 Tax=Macroventuria anomochaeta TaxID=301207 RepID=A0ACB6SEF7_9PLEO|nr:uncharacterized protein BU25DRAFT_80181 [Macroventuria anomochaeta]KAF2632675.1 hypothetical protein BU25DRAFT_80181 [Macroventuria anomochaeta]
MRVVNEAAAQHHVTQQPRYSHCNAMNMINRTKLITDAFSEQFCCWVKQRARTFMFQKEFGQSERASSRGRNFGPHLSTQKLSISSSTHAHFSYTSALSRLFVQIEISASQDSRSSDLKLHLRPSSPPTWRFDTCNPGRAVTTYTGMSPDPIEIDSFPNYQKEKERQSVDGWGKAFRGLQPMRRELYRLAPYAVSLLHIAIHLYSWLACITISTGSRRWYCGVSRHLLRLET